jgi:hypothetical protein
MRIDRRQADELYCWWLQSKKATWTLMPRDGQLLKNLKTGRRGILCCFRLAFSLEATNIK